MSAVFSVPTLTNGMVPSFRVGSQCSMSGALTAVDVQGLAGDERGTFEIEDPVDDIADLAGPTDGVQRSARLVGPGPYVGVLMTPSETALARTPPDAYSIASERVTAASPPFVNAVSAAGAWRLAWSTRLVLRLTMCRRLGGAWREPRAG